MQTRTVANLVCATTLGQIVRRYVAELHAKQCDVSNEKAHAEVVASLKVLLQRSWPRLLELDGGVSTLVSVLRLPPICSDSDHSEILQLHDGGTVRLTWSHSSSSVITCGAHGMVLILPGMGNTSNWAYVRVLMEAFKKHTFICVCIDCAQSSFESFRLVVTCALSRDHLTPCVRSRLCWPAVDIASHWGGRFVAGHSGSADAYANAKARRAFVRHRLFFGRLDVGKVLINFEYYASQDANDLCSSHCLVAIQPIRSHENIGVQHALEVCQRGSRILG